MKRLVTLIAVAALLGTVVASYAQAPDRDDTLILKATVAEYGAVWFGHEVDGVGESNDELSFDFNPAAVANGTAVAKRAALHFRANYMSDLTIKGKAPVMRMGDDEEFYATMVTDVKFLGGNVVGGSHHGKPLEWYFSEKDDGVDSDIPMTWSMWPGQVSASNHDYVTLWEYKNIHPWMKNGFDMDLGITMWPEIYRWDVGAAKGGTMKPDGGCWAIEGGEPGNPKEFSTAGVYETTPALAGSYAGGEVWAVLTAAVP
jgi:hypothetical protein